MFMLFSLVQSWLGLSSQSGVSLKSEMKKAIMIKVITTIGLSCSNCEIKNISIK